MAKTLFTASFEGGFHEWHSLTDWYSEQSNFDSPDACLDILDTLYANEVAEARGVSYRLVDKEEFAIELRKLSEKVVWEEGLDQTYLFAA
jgi:hypothetical protein